MAYSDCLQVEEKHFCVRCPEDFETEFAGARASGYIKKSYYPTLIASPLTISLWEAGIASGDIIVIPETRGTFDPGEPKEGKGYGDQKISYGARTMVLALVEKFDKDNLAFWDTIHLRTDLIPFFRTSSLLHIFKTAAIIKAGYAVSEDIEEVMEWAFTATVTGSLPSLHKYATIASIFECPAAAGGPLAITTQPTNKTGSDGDNITFTIAAAGGTAPRTFQLQKLVSGTYTNVGVPSQSAPSFVGATTAQNGTYRIIVADSANPAATVTSSTFTLTIAAAGGGTVGAPTGLDDSLKTDTTMRLAWVAPTGVVPDSYDVQVSTTNDFIGAPTINATSTNYPAGGLTIGTPYFVRVKSKKAGQPDSAWSTVLNVSTYNTVISFANGDNNAAAGVNGTVGNITGKANVRLFFDSITNPGGTPASMDVFVSSTQESVFAFTTDYVSIGGGRPFTYRDAASVLHDTIVGGTQAKFVDNNVNF